MTDLQIAGACMICFAAGGYFVWALYQICEAVRWSRWQRAGGRPVIRQRIDANSTVYAGSEAEAARIVRTIKDAQARGVLR